MGIKVNCCVVGEGMTNCYLLKNLDTQEIVLVDPGAGPGRIKKAVELMGGTVRGILLTHAHYDHIQAVPQLRVDYGVPVYA